MCGTRVYQAPELLGLLPQEFASSKGYTKSVDMWALGVLLYEMMTSKLPFQADDTSNTFCSEDATMMNEVAEGPTMDFAKLLHYCNGSSTFPIEPLQETTSTAGVDFVKRLLAANPKERISAPNARNTQWITGLDGTVTGLSRALRLQWLSLGVYFPVRVPEDWVECRDFGYKVVNILKSHLVAKGPTYRIQDEVARSGCPEVHTMLPLMIGDVDEATGTWSLLALAAADGYLEAISLLLDNGFDVNGKAGDYKGRTALQAAAIGGHLGAISLLLDSGADVNGKAGEYSGRTALQAAAEGGHLDAISLLLNRGADVNGQAGYIGGRTALQAAAEGGNLDAISLLLNGGADVNSQAGYVGGRMALQAAAEGGHLDAMRLLIESVANDNAVAAVGMGGAALTGAVQHGHVDAISLLLKNGADLNAPAATNFGKTALQTAAARGHISALSLLLKSGADVNAPAARKFGETALQAAAGRENMQATPLLLKSGADVNAPAAPVGGTTALEAAEKGGHPDAIRLLRRSGGVNTAAVEGGWLFSAEQFQSIRGWFKNTDE